jgi:hypothetical protein
LVLAGFGDGVGLKAPGIVEIRLASAAETETAKAASAAPASRSIRLMFRLMKILLNDIVLLLICLAATGRALASDPDCVTIAPVPNSAARMSVITPGCVAAAAPSRLDPGAGNSTKDGLRAIK